MLLSSIHIIVWRDFLQYSHSLRQYWFVECWECSVGWDTPVLLIILPVRQHWFQDQKKQEPAELFFASKKVKSWDLSPSNGSGKESHHESSSSWRLGSTLIMKGLFTRGNFLTVSNDLITVVPLQQHHKIALNVHTQQKVVGFNCVGEGEKGGSLYPAGQPGGKKNDTMLRVAA